MKYVAFGSMNMGCAYHKGEMHLRRANTHITSCGAKAAQITCRYRMRLGVNMKNAINGRESVLQLLVKTMFII